LQQPTSTSSGVNGAPGARMPTELRRGAVMEEPTTHALTPRVSRIMSTAEWWRVGHHVAELKFGSAAAAAIDSRRLSTSGGCSPGCPVACHRKMQLCRMCSGMPVHARPCLRAAVCHSSRVAADALLGGGVATPWQITAPVAEFTVANWGSDCCSIIARGESPTSVDVKPADEKAARGNVRDLSAPIHSRAVSQCEPPAAALWANAAEGGSQLP